HPGFGPINDHFRGFTEREDFFEKLRQPRERNPLYQAVEGAPFIRLEIEPMCWNDAMVDFLETANYSKAVEVPDLTTAIGWVGSHQGFSIVSGIPRRSMERLGGRVEFVDVTT